MIRFLFLLLLFLSPVLHAQPKEPLHVMLSKGPLPAWVNTSPSKQLSIAQTEKKSQGYKLSGAVKQIMAAANELQYNYLRSGTLLFNDEASVLANEIALKLLRGNFALRHSLKICVSYSNETNITVCPNGFMVIDLGLFAQLENEDQLAFIISHELAHLKSGDLTTSEQPVDFEQVTPEIREYIDYRRDRERLADSVGYQMYIEAGYAPGQVIRALDVMERNWLTPTALPFSPSMFTDSLFSYDEAVLSSVDSCGDGIGESAYYSSTQIEFPARKEQLAEWFKLKADASDSKQPSEEFVTLNKLAIYNCGLNALQKGEIPMALYLGFYLRTMDSLNRDEADLLIAKTLYINAALRGIERENKGPIVNKHANYPEYFTAFDEQDKDEERVYDERGYAAGAHFFLSQLDATKDAVLSVRWSWQYLHYTKAHRELANAIAVNSVTMLGTDREIPLAQLGQIETPIWVWAEKKVDVEADKKTERTLKKLEEARERASKYGLSETERLDSAIEKQRKELASTGHYEKNGATLYTQLQSLYSDSSFRQFYVQYGNLEASTALGNKPNPVLAKGDSVFLFDADFYWFEQQLAKDVLDYNAQKSEIESARSHAAVISSGKKHGLHIISLGGPSSDTVSVTLYNCYCIAARNMQESAGYSTERFTYPIAFREEFDALASATGVKHCINDFGVLRHFNSGLTLTYRKTSCLNLSTGNIDWIAYTMGKGNIASGQHLFRFFTTAKTGVEKNTR